MTDKITKIDADTVEIEHTEVFKEQFDKESLLAQKARLELLLSEFDK